MIFIFLPSVPPLLIIPHVDYIPKRAYPSVPSKQGNGPVEKPNKRGGQTLKAFLKPNQWVSTKTGYSFDI